MAVAANFKPTLETLNRRFTAQTGIAIRLSSASTGVLATQIRHGAPFDVLFAADAEYAAGLARLDLPGAGEPFCYAVGTLALAGGAPGDLADAGHSVAIANPATAPYGRAAMDVLAREAFAAGAGRTLVRGNNVAQAYQFWHSGAVDLALVARAVAPPEAAPVPADWHRPLQQHALALTADPRAARYLKWIRSDTVRSLIVEAGYQPCP
ncbi:MAG: molybdate ABC transporter substrate-binding protein [Halioglobus sp.]|nr:molybdate ABC transporter substrate-binding protein [Halioglobus sp.]